MEKINADITRLRSLAAKVEPGRTASGMLNDMFEAAEQWADLGDLLLKNSPLTDFPGRIQQEIELIEELRSLYKSTSEENGEILEILEIGSRLISIGTQRKLDPDGYLRSCRIIRERFSFLEYDFGFHLKTCVISTAEYAADHLSIELNLPGRYGSECWIKAVGEEQERLEIDDLLFRDGRIENLALPLGLEITTEAQVDAWFTKIAAILYEHGSDLLGNKPGAVERLKAASIERDHLYVKECERLWRLEHPGEPLPTFPS